MRSRHRAGLGAGRCVREDVPPGQLEVERSEPAEAERTRGGRANPRRQSEPAEAERTRGGKGAGEG